jgi:hypothetical protein
MPLRLSQEERRVYTAIRTSASRLIEKSRILLDFLSALDDPYGDYLFTLEARVHHLEAEVRTLRSLLGKPGGDVREGQ